MPTKPLFRSYSRCPLRPRVTYCRGSSREPALGRVDSRPSCWILGMVICRMAFHQPYGILHWNKLSVPTREWRFHLRESCTFDALLEEITYLFVCSSGAIGRRDLCLQQETGRLRFPQAGLQSYLHQDPSPPGNFQPLIDNTSEDGRT